MSVSGINQEKSVKEQPKTFWQRTTDLAKSTVQCISHAYSVFDNCANAVNRYTFDVVKYPVKYLDKRISEWIDDGNEEKLSIYERNWSFLEGNGNIIDGFATVQGIIGMVAIGTGVYVLVACGSLIAIVVGGGLIIIGSVEMLKGLYDLTKATTKEGAMKSGESFGSGFFTALMGSGIRAAGATAARLNKIAIKIEDYVKAKAAEAPEETTKFKPLKKEADAPKPAPEDKIMQLKTENTDNTTTKPFDETGLFKPAENQTVINIETVETKFLPENLANIKTENGEPLFSENAVDFITKAVSNNEKIKICRINNQEIANNAEIIYKPTEQASAALKIGETMKPSEITEANQIPDAKIVPLKSSEGLFLPAKETSEIQHQEIILDEILRSLKKKDGKQLLSEEDITKIVKEAKNDTTIIEITNEKAPKISETATKTKAKDAAKTAESQNLQSATEKFMSEVIPIEAKAYPNKTANEIASQVLNTNAANDTVANAQTQHKTKSGNISEILNTIKRVIPQTRREINNWLSKFKSKYGYQRFDEDEILAFSKFINEENFSLAESLIEDESNFSLSEVIKIIQILQVANSKNLPVIKELVKITYHGDARFSGDEIARIAEVVNKKNIQYLREFIDAKVNGNIPRFDGYDLAQMIKAADEDNIMYMKEFMRIKDDDNAYRFRGYEISQMGKAANKNTIAYMRSLIELKDKNSEDLSGFVIADITEHLHSSEFRDSQNDFGTLISVLISEFNDWDIRRILEKISHENLKAINELLNFRFNDEPVFDREFLVRYTEENKMPDSLEFIKNNTLFKRNENGTYEITENIDNLYEISEIALQRNRFNAELTDRMMRNQECSRNRILKIAEYTQDAISTKTAAELYNRNYSPEDIARIAYFLQSKLDFNIADTILHDESFNNETARFLLLNINNFNRYLALDLCRNYKEAGIETSRIPYILSNSRGITMDRIMLLKSRLGEEKFSGLSDKDFIISGRFINLYGKKDINEIPIAERRMFLRDLVAANADLFKISDDVKRDFPILPQNREEYCSLMPELVQSLGTETEQLTPEQVGMFNTSLGNLAHSLSKMPDENFANMEISQQYLTNMFVNDVLKVIMKLPEAERQKVYDYFGFELHYNKNTKSYSLEGFPVISRNSEKLEKINTPATRDAIKQLKPDVEKYSENNPIICNNPFVDTFLKETAALMPELRTIIGREQKAKNSISSIKHALRLIQKVAQNPKFEKLNDSDKKIILMASLIHDIQAISGTKTIHPEDRSLDAFFITQKFNLPQQEEIKLYKLIKNQEWLQYVDSALSEEDRTQRMQYIAYELYQDNLFDMAEILTRANLEVARDEASARAAADGINPLGVTNKINNYEKREQIYSKEIRRYIKALKASQPLLPRTKIPSAEKIAKRITIVNSDGSTNIEGLYSRNDGLSIIKFNEVKDWEALGFPEGTTSRGIKMVIEDQEIDTGNIKFIAHGLDYPEQLSKFDAFGLPNSDALLSVSYMELPESKFRLFRPQGVILDFNSEYIHGGGETDAGSGCKKNIAGFIRDYLFGGGRESDRLFISKMIKDATGMNDEQYIQFVEHNKNKSFTEIEPAEYRDKILKAFAAINSSTRWGNRAYNEMYGSNPNKVEAVYVYNMNLGEEIGNPIIFLDRETKGLFEDKSVKERTNFLQEYAKKRNIPLIIFGD